MLVNAGFPVPTAWAYDRIKPHPGPGIDGMLSAFSSGDLVAVARAAYNAFETPVYSKFPLLALIAETMMAAGALCVCLSGSGPTQFALLPDLQVAPKIEEALEERFGEALWIWSGMSG